MLTAEDLEDVQARADAIGVYLCASLIEDNTVWLDNIERDTGGPGSGRRALDMLLELADEHEASVSLAVVEICEPVIAIYEDAGFIRMDDPDRAEDGYAVMTREPTT